MLGSYDQPYANITLHNRKSGMMEDGRERAMRARKVSLIWACLGSIQNLTIVREGLASLGKILFVMSKAYTDLNIIWHFC